MPTLELLDDSIYFLHIIRLRLSICGEPSNITNILILDRNWLYGGGHRKDGLAKIYANSFDGESSKDNKRHQQKRLVIRINKI